MFILTREKSLLAICGGAIGKDKVCLEDTSCSVSAHATNKAQNIRPGIYIAAPTTNRSHFVAFKEPVGDLSLLEEYGDYIMTNLSTTVAVWTKIFEVLGEADSFQEAMSRLGHPIPEEGYGSRTPIKTHTLESTVSMEVPPSPTVIPRKREAQEISPSLEGAVAARLDEATSAQVQEAFSLAQGVLEVTAEQTGSKINLGKQGPKLSTILNSTYQMTRN